MSENTSESEGKTSDAAEVTHGKPRHKEPWPNGCCFINRKDFNKVIFLDMDGVMNPAFAGNSYITKGSANALKRIVAETGAKVVLSTSWREFPDWAHFLRDFFAILDIEVIGATPVLHLKDCPEGTQDERPVEIRTWLERFGGDIGSGMVNYVVFDDNDYRRDFPNHAVCTCASGRIGLDEEWANDAIAILKVRKEWKHGKGEVCAG